MTQNLEGITASLIHYFQTFLNFLTFLFKLVAKHGFSRIQMLPVSSRAFVCVSAYNSHFYRECL